MVDENTSYPKRNKPARAPSSADRKPGLQARQVAAKIISAVIDKKTSLDGMFDAHHGNPAYRELNDADRALVRAILNSSLRQLPRIDAMIGSLLQTPLPEGARSLNHILTIGAAQILYLDVPDHSAVDLAVEQALIDPRTKRFGNLVNAILRRMSREKEHLLSTIGEATPVFPRWFEDRLLHSYGKEETDRIAEVFLSPAAIDLTVKSNSQGWAEKLGGRVLPTGSVRLAGYSGAIPYLHGFDDGEWWVQDAAAAIPVQLFGSLDGKRIVDLCAAPGGKAAQLATMGAEVTALDQSGNRLKRMKENFDRLKLDVATLEMNTVDFRPDDLFDAALLDAPCSSTGTIRRHPDVLWTKGPDDIEKLANVQEKLLRHAHTVVKPGGTVVFSNCSLDKREGEEVVAHVISDGLYSMIPIDPANWPGLEDAVTPLGEMRTTPAMIPAEGGYAGGLDGFYAAVLRREP